MIPIDLSGQVVVVTGAAGGIGRGIVRRFADAGASLVLQHHRSTPPASEGAVTVQADLTSPSGPAAVIEAGIKAFDRLDALVNCAGVQPVAAFHAISEEEWANMLATNVTAAHRLTQRFAAHVRERGGVGSVVHVASIEGRQPAPGHAHYAASKAALIMHAKAAAIELGSIGVRVNSVSPGLIERDGIVEAWPEGVERWRRAAPLERLGRPEDIGDACVFLCSPLAQWVTGIDLVVDGGVSARPTW
jgi:NAD(P)-dependent dehydrogenase (short-subunit alcohol dehydrogenase family)